MEPVKILDRRGRLDWMYDRASDVLYISVGKPRKAIGIDTGQGVVVRYDEAKREVVGLTILGMRQRVAESLAAQPSDGRRRRKRA
jgi:uncharacterized protein YuzE